MAEPSGLREYALLLWRKRVTILVVAAICVVGTLGYCILMKPTYQASASVLLEPPISQTLSRPTPASIAAAPQRARRDRGDRERQRRPLVAKTLPGAPSVTATQVGTTDVVQVAVRSKDPQLAAGGRQRLRQGVHPLRAETDDRHLQLGPGPAAEQGRHGATRHRQPERPDQARRPTTNLTPDETQLGDLQDQLATLQNQLQNYQFDSSQGVTTEVGQVISSATVPTKPVSPKTVEWTVLALIFGLILGIGVALLVNALAPGPAATLHRRSGRSRPFPSGRRDASAAAGATGRSIRRSLSHIARWKGTVPWRLVMGACAHRCSPLVGLRRGAAMPGGQRSGPRGPAGAGSGRPRPRPTPSAGGRRGAARWTPQAASYGTGSLLDQPVTMSDGTILRADVYFPTTAGTSTAATGCSRCCCSRRPTARSSSSTRRPSPTRTSTTSSTGATSW